MDLSPTARGKRVAESARALNAAADDHGIVPLQVGASRGRRVGRVRLRAPWVVTCPQLTPPSYIQTRGLLLAAPPAVGDAQRCLHPAVPIV